MGSEEQGNLVSRSGLPTTSLTLPPGPHGQALLVKVDTEYNVTHEEEIDVGLVQCGDILKVRIGGLQLQHTARPRRQWLPSR